MLFVVKHSFFWGLVCTRFNIVKTNLDESTFNNNVVCFKYKNCTNTVH